jgi:hypothetical protein
MGRARSQYRRGNAAGWFWLFVSFLVIILTVCIFRSRIHVDGWDVRPQAQLHSIDAAVEISNNEFNRYPPSEADDPAGLPYCGAMKLAEALMGQDLLGFHSNSIFRRDGMSAQRDLVLYPEDFARLTPQQRDSTLRARKGPFLQAENANAWRLEDVYGADKTSPFPGNVFVLCDVFERDRPSGKKTGMPILYYRANPAGTAHDVNDPNNPRNIYSYKDNLVLINLGVPGDPNTVHPLADPRRFYLNTRNDRIAGPAQPYRKDSYLLISAGWDGLYGTADDICNFEWRYHER